MITQVENQFRLYQDGLEEKANDNKKGWADVEKEIEGYKKKIEDLREIKSNHAEQINKLQHENEQLKC